MREVIQKFCVWFMLHGIETWLVKKESMMAF